MRKAEQKVWDAMKRAATKHAPKMWLQRVENLVGDGMPDVFAEGVWLELKAATLPKRAETRLQYSEGLRPQQENWLLKADRRGVPCYILVRVEDRKDEPLLIPAHFAACFNDLSWDVAKPRASAVGWDAIFKRLEEDIEGLQAAACTYCS